jgi:hypothetical protein
MDQSRWLLNDSAQAARQSRAGPDLFEERGGPYNYFSFQFFLFFFEK